MTRLLHVRTALETMPVRFASDPYIPVGIEIGPSLDDRLTLPPPHLHAIPLYWRLVDPAFSLVEVGIDRGTGGLMSVTIPMYKGEIRRDDQVEASIVPASPGVPLFDLGLWMPEGFIEPTGERHDVPGQCRVSIGDSCVQVELFSDRIAYDVRTGDLTCSFNLGKELCALRVDNLSMSSIVALSRYSE